MTTQSKTTSTFTNQYGDKWTFVYDPTTGQALLTGQDVDGKEYPVLENGQVPDLVLNPQEQQWLQESLVKAVEEQKRG